jgi:membrane protein involved in colicin uptake
LKDHNNAIKMKAKEEAKKAKEEEKQAKIEAKKKAKEDEKQAKIEAKLKAKEEAKKMKPKTASENVVLGPQVVEVTYTECIEILKSGPNKGKQCGAKASNSNYCKRHTKKSDSHSDPTPEI